MVVLLVEDHLDTLGAMRFLLRSRGMDVVTAETVARAMTVIDEPKKPIDAALVDLMLPDGDGIEVLEALALRRPTVRRFSTSAASDAQLLGPAKALSIMLFEKPYADVLKIIQAILFGKYA
jgi:two-component system response regulator RegA